MLKNGVLNAALKEMTLRLLSGMADASTARVCGFMFYEKKIYPPIYVHINADG